MHKFKSTTENERELKATILNTKDAITIFLNQGDRFNIYWKWQIKESVNLKTDQQTISKKNRGKDLKKKINRSFSDLWKQYPKVLTYT